VPRYKVTIEYDGSGYVGWQRQSCGRSLEQAINQAFFRFTQTRCPVVGSGRTDSGVHAWGQVAHVDLPKRYPEYMVRDAVNAHLRNHSINIKEVICVDPDFHARFSAIKRSYIYRLYNRQTCPPFERGRAWHIRYPIAVDAMQQCANVLVGTHDFSTFRDSACQAQSPVRKINGVHFTQNGPVVTLTITGQSFLHHQVRNIMGTLNLVGKGTWTVDNFEQAFQARNRKAGGPTAPAEGLYLYQVDYP